MVYSTTAAQHSQLHALDCPLRALLLGLRSVTHCQQNFPQCIPFACRRSSLQSPLLSAAFTCSTEHSPTPLPRGPKAQNHSSLRKPPNLPFHTHSLLLRLHKKQTRGFFKLHLCNFTHIHQSVNQNCMHKRYPIKRLNAYLVQFACQLPVC